MADFIRFHNHVRNHEWIGNVTPTDVYAGRWEAILGWRVRQKSRTQAERVRYNLAGATQGTRGLTGERSAPQSLAEF